MTKENLRRRYDVFHSFLVENADYVGKYEMPIIKTSDNIPENVITFSKQWRERQQILTNGLYFTNTMWGSSDYGAIRSSIWIG